MGCFGSRFDKRNSAAGDLNTVGLQFVGGEAHVSDFCPVDKILLDYSGELDLAEKFKCEGLKLSDDALGQELGLLIHKATSELLASIDKKYGSPQDGKKVYIGNKHELVDVLADLKAVLKALEEDTGVVVEKPAAADAPAMDPPAADAPAMDAPAMDAPAEGEMMMDLPSAAKSPYDGDATDYKGFGNLPTLLLALSVKHPFFGDVVKAQLINWEFNYESDKPSELQFLAAVGLMDAGVELAEAAGTATKVFFSGFAGEDDFASLTGMAEAKSDILFPGVIAGWATKEEAVAALVGQGEQGSDLTKVIYEAETKVVSSVHCRLFVHRYSATLEKLELVDGIQVITLKELEAPLKSKLSASIKEWKAKAEELKNAPAVAETPVVAEMAKDDMAMGDMMAADDMAMMM
jgi:hypothetical protein